MNNSLDKMMVEQIFKMVEDLFKYRAQGAVLDNHHKHYHHKPFTIHSLDHGDSEEIKIELFKESLTDNKTYKRIETLVFLTIKKKIDPPEFDILAFRSGNWLDKLKERVTASIEAKVGSNCFEPIDDDEYFVENHQLRPLFPIPK